MTDLADQEFTPCREDAGPLAGESLERLHKELDGDWRLVDGHHLVKEYRFDDFRGALEFTNRVGELAEQLDHHPEIWLTWGRVELKIYTHKIGGLAEGDFVWAARADRLA